MFLWVFRGKLDSGMSTCGFSVNTYVSIIVVNNNTKFALALTYCDPPENTDTIVYHLHALRDNLL